VVVPPSTDTGAALDTLEIAATELIRLIRVQGFDVISPGQASASAEDAQQSGNFPAHLNPLDCRSVECAIEYRRLFDASFAAQLLLSGATGKARTVTVTITEGANASFKSSAEIQGSDLKGAVSAAYASARDKYVRGEGPWLSIAGGPAGAIVLVDGQEYGSLPIERRYIGGGIHQVEVRAPGYSTEKFELNIPGRIDHEERREVALSALAGHGAKPAKLDRTWDYVVGSALAAAGALHLGFGIYQALKSGDCAVGDGTICTRRYGDNHSPKQENLLIGLGAAGIAAGAIWMGVGPIARLSVRADSRSAALSLSGAF
jgi:hypothetical protein